MKNFKIYYNKKIITLLLSTTLVLYASGCQDKAYIENQNYQPSNQQEKINQAQSTASSTIPGTSEIKKEEEILNYFENVEAKYEKQNINYTDKLKQELKEDYENIVDFIFNDKEVYGIKFKDLSKEVQDSIIKIFETIDKTIDHVFPDYKKKISNAYDKAKTSVKDTKDKVKEKVENKIEEKGQTENYERLKEITKENWEETKQEAKEYLDTTIELGGKAKEKLKEWFKN